MPMWPGAPVPQRREETALSVAAPVNSSWRRNILSFGTIHRCRYETRRCHFNSGVVISAAAGREEVEDRRPSSYMLNKTTPMGKWQCRCRSAKSMIVETLSLSIEYGFI